MSEDPWPAELAHLEERNLVDHPFVREAARSWGEEYSDFDWRYYDDPESATGYRGYGEEGNGSEGRRAFDDEADLIAAIPGVRRVLDVGCAKGYLVAALHQRGIEANGIDVSAYAVGNAPPEVRPYLQVSSVEAYEPDGAFDLVHASGVLLYLELTPLRRALRKLHALSRVGAVFDEPTREHFLALYNARDPGAIDPLRRQELSHGTWQALFREAGFLPNGHWYRREPRAPRSAGLPGEGDRTCSTPG